MESIRNLQGQHEKALAAYQDAGREAQELRIEFQAKNRRFLDAQAGLLADGLVDGVPCPVCGSREHPLPARFTEGAPSREEIQALEKRKNNAKDRERKRSTAAGKLSGRLTALEGNVQETVGRFHEPVSDLISVRQVGEKASREWEKIRLSLVETEKEILRLQQMEKLIEENERNIETCRKKQDDAERTGVLHREEKRHLTKRVSEIARGLDFDDAFGARREIERLRGEASRLEKEAENVREALAANAREQAVIRGSKEELQRQLNRGCQVELQDIGGKVEAKVEERKILGRRQKEVYTRLQINRLAWENIRVGYENLKEIEEQLKWMGTLAHTAGGGLSGKDKVTLEAYAQMAYFDRIIAQANQRFLIMSDGQYEFRRRREGTDKKSKSGSELDIHDHYNGSIRGVNTLSGGESFMASLSLALGLSDEIQAMAGGIRLDTMFVDEGFGTLDEETLNQAMKVLNKIAENSRLVGIISHVVELKEKINRQIVVTKNKSGGSRARIVLE